MSTAERYVFNPSEKKPSIKGRIIKSTAVAALVSELVACSPESKAFNPNLPERNAPDTSEYSLDTNPTFYGDVDNMFEFTETPEVIEKLEALKETPVAAWLTHDDEVVQERLMSSLEKSRDTQTIPIFVVYNIPNRDNGSFSSGGAASSDDYLDWVNGISDTIGDQPSVVVLEPDALSHIGDISDDEARERIETLGSTLDTFSNNENTAVYLDAGNSTWISAEETAQLLKEVNEKSNTGVKGISLNVSNFNSEEDTRDFASAIETAYNSRLFILIDNSRNGAPEAVGDNDWCNPEGQRIGTIDSVFDPEAAVETAFIKTPGQSDGVCGTSQRPAGEFDGELLLRQLGDR